MVQQPGSGHNCNATYTGAVFTALKIVGQAVVFPPLQAARGVVSRYTHSAYLLKHSEILCWNFFLKHFGLKPGSGMSI